MECLPVRFDEGLPRHRYLRPIIIPNGRSARLSARIGEIGDIDDRYPRPIATGQPISARKLAHNGVGRVYWPIDRYGSRRLTTLLPPPPSSFQRTFLCANPIIEFALERTISTGTLCTRNRVEQYLE